MFGSACLFAFGPLPTVAPAFPNDHVRGHRRRPGRHVRREPRRRRVRERRGQEIRGIQFAEQEAGCLVGNVAALEMVREHRNTISAIGAIKVPAIVRYIAGYKYCAQRVSKKIQVLVNYANDSTFADQAKCKATALAQIAAVARDLRGRRPVRPRRPRRGEDGARLGHRRRRRPVLPREAHADQRAEEGGPAVFDTIKEYNANPSAFKGGTKALHPQERRGRLRPAEPEAPGRRATSSPRARTNLEQQIIKGTVSPRRSSRTLWGAGRSVRPRCPLGCATWPTTARPRAQGDHEALPRRRRERRRRLRPAPRRGPRPARRERRRQVDADERPLRPVPARRGRDPPRRQAGHVPLAADAIRPGIGMVHQHFMLIPVMTVAENIVLGAEPTDGRVLLDYGAARKRVREISSDVRARSRPGRADRGHHRRPAAARRDPEGALPRRRHPRSSTSRRPC